MESEGRTQPQNHIGPDRTEDHGTSEHAFLPLYVSEKKAPVKTYYDASVLCDRWALDDVICDGATIDFANSNKEIFEEKYALLAWANSILAASPTCRRMLSEAANEGWFIALETLSGPDFHLDVPQKLVVLDDNGLISAALGQSEYFRNSLLISFIRALRDMWQEKRHGAFDETYGPAEVLYLERTRTADLDVLSVQVAWELRGEGLNGLGGSLWRHLIGSEEGDIAMRYSSMLERDPASAYSGKALQAAFVQWFQDPARVNSCDHETLNYLDGVLAETAQTEPFGSKKLTPVGIEILSCMPDKTAYLQGFGGEILTAPLYAGLDDMVNQSHLMQLLHDMKAVRVQSVPFRSALLAAKIFPGGEFTPEA